MMPSIPTASLKSVACSTQSFPVIASPTKMFRSGLLILMSFFSSFIKLSLLWSLPAESMSTTSSPFAVACFTASKATAAGSAL